MQVLFERKSNILPKLSIILLDWSCRESCHILDYLRDQTVSRDQYEIIWIEYYDKRSPEIDGKLKECALNNRPPVVDQWIVMDMPKDIYYHKHLMYNMGIAASRGDIVTICDSDAVVNPTFVESILKAFKKDPNIVLHIDQVRNVNKKFYPFNNPTIGEITAQGCINFRNGKTTGVMEQEDPLHARNYGACMSSRRDDLLKIGGADEHTDYIGHICGPYEMTFRLVNSGKKEVWHQEEFIYHTWHPGSDGHKNHLGPHDGQGMSTTALDTRRSGRVMPLVENRTIEALRLNSKSPHSSELMMQSFSISGMEQWSKARLRQMQRDIPTIPVQFSLKDIWIKALLLRTIVLMLVKQVSFKSKVQGQNEIIRKNFFVKVKLAFAFIRRMWRNNIYTTRVCQQIISRLKSEGIHEAGIYGAGDIAKILQIIAGKLLFKIVSIEKFNDYQGKIIIASFTGIIEKAQRLKSMGIEESNIVRLQ